MSLDKFIVYQISIVKGWSILAACSALLQNCGEFARI